jgi:integrase
MELALDDPDRRSELTKDKSTVSDLIIRYVKEVDSIKPIGMTKRYTLAFLTGCPIGDVRACDLRASDIINHCKRRQKLGAAPATVQHDVVYLRGVFGMAKPAWNVNVSVTAFDEAGYTLKKLSLVGKSTARTRRLDASEWAALSAYWDRVGAKTQATRIPIRDIVEFALACPLRQGEIMRLRWCDIDEAKRLIKVLDRKHPTKKHDDVIPLLGAAYELIMRQPRIDEFIFPFNQDSVAAAWERAKNDCKLVDITFHDLRHEGISRMFEAGYSIEQVAIVSGHRDWNSLRRYTHIKPETLHR